MSVHVLTIFFSGDHEVAQDLEGIVASIAPYMVDNVITDLVEKEYNN